MSTKAVPPPSSGPPSASPPQLPPTPAPVVVLRSAKVPVVVEHHPAAPAGSTAVVRVLPLAKDSADNTRTLKNLSNDLSELLVKNLSLKRNSEGFCGTVVVEDPLRDESSVGGGGDDRHYSSDSLGLITRSKQANRNSLCDTFSSVNKLIKLKRVSSDSSSISGYTKIYHPGGVDVPGQQHSINPPPQAKFKRVEISVQELPAESIGPRKGIIVNQFDQFVSSTNESESVPLLANKKPSWEVGSTGNGEVLGGSKVPNCDSVGVKFRRRIQHPVAAGRVDRKSVV